MAETNTKSLAGVDPTRQQMFQSARTELLQAFMDRDAAGTLRVIAGEYDKKHGPARTFTPINVWDLRLRRDGSTSLDLPEGHTAALVVLRGTVLVNGREIAREAQLVLLDRTGGDVTLEANSDATVLVLTGEPIDEPVVMHGPFVMNTKAELVQAFQDFESGKLGVIPHGALGIS